MNQGVAEKLGRGVIVKPDVPVARRSDYTFRQVDHAIGAALIREHHYARGCSKTGTMYGMFRGDALVGVAQWLPPTKVCAQSVLPEHDLWKYVVSLTRLVVLPSEPQNAASMLIGASLRWLPTLRTPWSQRKWLAAVTFADDSEGHTGAIYKATNWIEKGKTKPYPRWVSTDEVQVSTKCGPKTRTKAEMEALGHRIVGYFKKSKFVFHFA